MKIYMYGWIRCLCALLGPARCCADGLHGSQVVICVHTAVTSNSREAVTSDWPHIIFVLLHILDGPWYAGMQTRREGS
jgi:hypothetical protein